MFKSFPGKRRRFVACWLCKQVSVQQKLIRRDKMRMHLSANHAKFVEFFSEKRRVSLGNAAELFVEMHHSIPKLKALTDEFVRLYGRELIYKQKKRKLEDITCWQCDLTLREDHMMRHFQFCHCRFLQFVSEKYAVTNTSKICQMMIVLHREAELLNELTEEFVSQHGHNSLTYNLLDDESSATDEARGCIVTRRVRVGSEAGQGSVHSDAEETSGVRRAKYTLDELSDHPFPSFLKTIASNDVLLSNEYSTNKSCTACVSIQCFRQCMLQILADVLQHECVGHEPVCCCDKEVFTFLVPLYAALVVKGKFGHLESQEEGEELRDTFDVESSFHTTLVNDELHYYCNVCPLSEEPAAISRKEEDPCSTIPIMEKINLRRKLQEHVLSEEHCQYAGYKRKKKVKGARRSVDPLEIMMEVEQVAPETISNVGYSGDLRDSEGNIEDAGKDADDDIPLLQLKIEEETDSSYNQDDKSTSQSVTPNSLPPKPGRTHFKCNYCSKTYITLKEMKEHRVIHTTCSKCFVSFQTANILHKHKKTAHQKKRAESNPDRDNPRSTYPCTECGENFTNTNLFVEHRKEVHGIDPFHFDARPFMCPVCHRPFNTVNGMQGHIESFHPEYWREFIAEHVAQHIS